MFRLGVPAAKTSCMVCHNQLAREADQTKICWAGTIVFCLLIDRRCVA